MGSACPAESIFYRMDLERAGLNQDVGARHQIQPDGAHAFLALIREAVMVPEEMQARTHGGQHLVDLRFPGVRAASARERTKGPGGFMGQEDLDAAQPLAR